MRIEQLILLRLIIVIRNMKNFLQLLIVLPFFSCGNNQSNAHPSSQKLGLDTAANIYSVTGEDTTMNGAIQKAKQTINEFDQALQSNNPAYTNFAVKKRYKTADDGGEHIWIAEISLENGNYKGFVNNDAENTSEVKYGDAVIVKKGEITDWMYLDKSVLRGGYTIRAVRNNLTGDERSQMDKRLGFKIEN
jgi:uncharacterized protein YegJ (DUF2314 family)